MAHLEFSDAGLLRQAARIGALAFAIGLGVSGCKQQEVQFSRVPALGVAKVEPASFETTVFAGQPVDAGPFLSALDRALSIGFKARNDVDRLVCERYRSQWIECIGGYVVSEVRREGPGVLKVENGQLRLQLPLAYDVVGRGYGWGARFSERKSGTVTASVPIEISLGAGFRTQLRLGREINYDQSTVALLKAEIGIATLADGRLRSAVDASLDQLRAALDPSTLRERVQDAWYALTRPVALMPGQWLEADPIRVQGAHFTVNDAAEVGVHIGIGVRGRISDQLDGIARSVKAMPEPVRQTDGLRETRLRLPFAVSTVGLVEALQLLLPAGEMIETRADPRSPALLVKTERVGLVAAQNRVAIEVELAVVEPKRLAGLTGKAYFMARPVLRHDTSMLEFDDIGFPAAPKRAAGALVVPEVGAKQLLRIGEEPYAGRIQVAARVPLGDALSDFLPDLNRGARQALPQGLSIEAAFSNLSIVDTQPVDGAILFTLDAVGTLTITSARAGGRVPPMEAPGAAVSRIPVQ